MQLFIPRLNCNGGWMGFNILMQLSALSDLFIILVMHNQKQNMLCTLN